MREARTAMLRRPRGADMTNRRTPSRGGSYDVGYGKPPTGTQFGKGISGNKKGRPKGAKNLATLLIDALYEEVTVTVNGVPQRISKLELMLRQLADQGADGDLRALNIILQRVDFAQNRATAEQADVLDDAEHEVAQAIIERIRNAPEEPDND
jgi:hypothetical protein